MIPKPFHDIERSDIDALRENEVREGKRIEYKVNLPGNSDRDKKEFLADVSSFANSSGGDLLFGVNEEKGVPTDAHGLTGINPDKEIQRLDNVLRDGLDPRIPGVQMRAVEGFPQGPVLLVRIPRSWASPHMVTFRGSSRFYARNNAGKYQMDVGEVRAAFALSEALPEKVRAFRCDRLAKIVARETPLPLADGPLAVLHLLPIASLEPGHAVDPASLQQHQPLPRPLDANSRSHRYSFDGLLEFAKDRTGVPYTYVLFFRNGAIEAVSARTLPCGPGHEGCIASYAYEDSILEGLAEYLALIRGLEMSPPIFVMLSLLGVQGLHMFVEARYGAGGAPEGIDRDVLVLPEVIVENFDDDLGGLLKPVFDCVWQAAGWRGSRNYDEDGKWIRRA